MKIPNFFYKIVLILTVTGIVTTLSIRANAQEDVVHYLEGKFKDQNIPVVEITILEKSPLSLRIIVLSEDKWTTTDDTVVLNSVDRAVFIYARQEGYIINNLIRILQDSEGKQLDYTQKSADIERLDKILATNTSLSMLTDKDTQSLLLEKIIPFLDEYNLHGVPLTLDISSVDGYQTLTLELQTSSLDVANNAAYFFWSLPRFSLFDEINTEGAKIVLYRAKVIDENGANLLDFMYDFQLGSGGWTKDERLIDLDGGSAPVPTEPLIEAPIATDLPTEIPVSTATP